LGPPPTLPLDLSLAAAQSLGMEDRGVIKIRAEVP
jgi:rare lipoprotein A (peptidoglycan hydrolase)